MSFSASSVASYGRGKIQCVTWVEVLKLRRVWGAHCSGRKLLGRAPKPSLFLPNLAVLRGKLLPSHLDLRGGKGGMGASVGLADNTH